jgi:hypothetical protein
MSEFFVKAIDNETELSPLFSETYEYWQSLSVDGLGTFDKFQLDAVPAKLLAWSVLVDVEDQGTVFRYRFWGTERVKLIGAELTGKTTSEIVNPLMRQGNHDEYLAIYREKRPLLCQTPIVTSFERELTMTSIRFPFFDAQNNVSHIYSAIDPAEITDQHYTHFGTRRRSGV